MSDTYKKIFNLVMESSLYAELNRKAALLQMKTGNRVSLTSLINQVLTQYINESEE